MEMLQLSLKQRIYRKICYLFGRLIPDKIYLKMMYQVNMGKKLNLKNPVCYNEKLNWLKLYDRKDIYTKMADKYAVREIISQRLGEEYLIPLLGVWEHVEDIDFSKLPNQFVLKCTHDSESVIICRDKSLFDEKAAVKKLSEAMKRNYYYYSREWTYKNIKPRIIAEKYMEDSVDGELRDYKFFCFDGIPKAMFVATDRGKGETKFDYFDVNFKHLDLIQHYPNATQPIRKPVNYDKMLEFSKILSKDIPHVRVDFYEVDGKLYFGELTFYHFGGYMPFEPESWDIVFGEWLKLQ
ncbi:MAG: ATP-grasp fold amidoligase family protein [Lachnospiraceae bacterium]|nr:ATP-grasp fold amidoligase family protein [Lachnospiraceae bacterium]